MNILAHAGQCVTLSPADPAAGADLSYALPGGFRYYIHSVKFRIVTAVAVANRAMRLELFDISLADVVYRTHNTVYITASNDVIVSYGIQGANSGSITASAFEISGLPNDVILTANYRIQTNILNLQAADQISAARILATRFIV